MTNSIPRTLINHLTKILTGLVLGVVVWIHAIGGLYGMVLLILLFFDFAVYEFGRYGDLIFRKMMSAPPWRMAWIGALTASTVSTIVLSGTDSLPTTAVELASIVSLLALREVEFRVNRHAISREVEGLLDERKPSGFLRQLAEPLMGLSFLVSVGNLFSLFGEHDYPLVVARVVTLGVSVPAFVVSIWIWRRRVSGHDRWLRPLGTVTGYALFAAVLAAITLSLKLSATSES